MGRQRVLRNNRDRHQYKVRVPKETGGHEELGSEKTTQRWARERERDVDQCQGQISPPERQYSIVAKSLCSSFCLYAPTQIIKPYKLQFPHL